MKRGRAEEESDVAFGKRVAVAEGESEGAGLAEEFGVGEALTVDGVDEQGGCGGIGGAGAEERESELYNRERLRRRWERYVWSQGMVSFGERTEAGVWIDRTVWISFGH